MTVPLQITFRDLPSSAAVSSRGVGLQGSHTRLGSDGRPLAVMAA